MGILSLFQRKQKNTQVVLKVILLWKGQQTVFLAKEESK